MATIGKPSGRGDPRQVEWEQRLRADAELPDVLFLFFQMVKNANGDDKNWMIMYITKASFC